MIAACVWLRSPLPHSPFLLLLLLLPPPPNRYQPEVEARLRAFAHVTPQGVPVDIGVEGEGGTKLAVEGVAARQLAADGKALVGRAVSRKKVRALLPDGA